MSWRDPFHLQILWSISCQLENLCPERISKLVYGHQGDIWGLTGLTNDRLWGVQDELLVITSSEVLKDGRAVHSSSGPNSPRGGGARFQMTVDSEICLVDIDSNGKSSCVGPGLGTSGEMLHLPTGNWSPALALLLTAFCFALPESLPALPPAISGKKFTTLLWALLKNQIW